MSERKFKDVFSLLKNASKACLNDDIPMLASDDFSLYESMSATVIMDEKMDPCHGISCSTFENFISTCYEKCGPSNADTATLLIEELFIREVALLDGASLLESLHQGLHMWPETWKLMDQSDSLSEKWLLTYCKSTVAASTVYLRMVMNADIFEDEDFQFSSQVSCFLSQDEMESLKTETSDLSDAKGDASVFSNGYLPLFFKYRTVLFQLHEAMDDLVSLSLTLPLTTRGTNTSPQQLAHLMTALEKDTTSEQEQQQEQSDAQLKASLNQVYTLAYTLREIVTSIAVHPSSSRLNRNSNSEPNQHLDKSFLASLMSLKQNSPARTFPLLTLADSLVYVQDMCQDILCACTALDAMIFQTKNTDIDTLFQWFMAFSRNKSNVLVRSYVVAVWTFVKPHAKLFLLNSCSSRGLPDSYLCNSVCEEWLRTSAAFLLWDTLKVLTVHRNKVQLKWDGLFSRWGNFVLEAQYVDNAISMQLLGQASESAEHAPAPQPWFSMWTLSLMTSVMDVFMELFIELDLLQPSELSSFYWYWDYVISTKGHALKNLRELHSRLAIQLHEVDILEAKEAVTKAKSVMNNSKKNKKTKDSFNNAKAKYAALITAPPPPPAAYSTEEIFLILKGQLLKAQYRMFLALDEEGAAIKPTSSPVSSPALIFESRFRSFQAIGNPAPIGYADFLATKTSSSPESLAPDALITSADGILKTVKTLIEKAVSALPIDTYRGVGQGGQGRWPRCVCRGGSNATSKLTVEQLYPCKELEAPHAKEQVATAAVMLEDMMGLYEGQAKVSVTLSLACTRQLQRLAGPKAASNTSHRLKLDRKFSDFFPVPTVDVVIKE